MKKLYSLFFICASSTLSVFAQTPPLPNGGFESWEGSGSSMEPVSYNSNKTGTGYATSGPQTLFQDNTTMHSGTYSARMETVSFVIATVNGSLTSGIVNAPSTNKLQGYLGTIQNTTTTDIRRISFDGRPDSLVGWYKYVQSTSTSGTGGANEQGKVRAILHMGHYYDPETPVSSNHPDSTVNKIGDATFLTPMANVSAWTRFSVPFTYVDGRTPQYIMLNCTSSNNQNTSVAGSKMWLDDVAVVYNSTTGIDNPAAKSENNVKVYAADKTIYIDFLIRTETESTLSVYDLSGKLVVSQKITNNKLTTVNMSNVNPGIYLYQLSGTGFQKSGKLQIQ
ncbi:MAG: hypothetical protein JWP12_951 [Bacteroidetes bacterium]|nr:hypothetical protein [Bacteroidota bacterium]